MKKIIITSALSIFSAGVFSQSALDAQLKEAQCKTAAEDIARAEKATLDPKKSLKSSNWVKLAVAYEDMAAMCGKDSMAAEKAYKTYKKAVEVEKAAGGKGLKEIEAAMVSQKMYQILLQQGAALYNGKNTKNALTLFKLSSEVNPKDTTAALYAGIAAQNEKDFETAKSYFGKYIEVGGKSPEVFYSLAQIYKNEKNIQKAIEILRKGVAVNPNDKDLKGEIVNMNLSSGDNEGAINELKKLVETDPRNVTNVLNLGILYDNAGKKAEALVYYNKVLELDPNNFDCNFNLGVMNFNQAVEMKKEIDKMDMKTYQKEGKAIEDRVCAKFSEAKPFFDKCLAVKPNDEDVKNTYEGLKGVLDQCSKRK